MKINQLVDHSLITHANMHKKVQVVLKIVFFVVQMNELTDSPLRFLSRQASSHSIMLILNVLPFKY